MVTNPNTIWNGQNPNWKVEAYGPLTDKIWLDRHESSTQLKPGIYALYDTEKYATYLPSGYQQKCVIELVKINKVFGKELILDRPVTRNSYFTAEGTRIAYVPDAIENVVYNYRNRSLRPKWFGCIYGLEISNLHVDGYNTDALRLDLCSNVKINNCTFSNGDTEGAGMGRSLFLQWCAYCNVSEVQGETGRHLVQLSGCGNTTIANCEGKNYTSHVIDLHGLYSYDVAIQNCYGRSCQIGNGSYDGFESTIGIKNCYFDEAMFIVGKTDLILLNHVTSKRLALIANSTTSYSNNVQAISCVFDMPENEIPEDDPVSIVEYNPRESYGNLTLGGCKIVQNINKPGRVCVRSIGLNGIFSDIGLNTYINANNSDPIDITYV